MNSKKLRNRKIFILAFLMICTGVLLTFLPSLARINNRNPIDTNTVWDGEVATSYRSGTGTKSDPYIIASGKELSYFSNMLKNTSYEGKYFALSNDIVLNNGIFSYDNASTYTLNNSTFYLKKGSADFYDNAELSGVKIGSLNILEPLNNFKGHFDGNSYTIFGLYITSPSNESGLFTNLQGEIENLYVTNALIEGGSITGGIASNAKDSTIKNVLFSGHVIGNDEIKKDSETLSLENITINLNPVEVTLPESQKQGTITNATLRGTCSTNFMIDKVPVECTDSIFEISLDNNYKDTMTIESTQEVSLSNMTLNLSYDIGYAGGIVGLGENLTLENVINKAHIKSSDTAAGLIASTSNSFQIKNSYNSGEIDTTNNYSGLVGVVRDLKNNSTISTSYNNAENHSGFVGNVYNSSNYLTIENSFEAGKNYAFIKKIGNSKVKFNNVYSIGTNEFNPAEVDGTVTNISLDSLKNKDFMTSTLSFNEFLDKDHLNTPSSNVWIYEAGYLPSLYIDDLQDPVAALHVGTHSWNNLGFDEHRIYYQSKVAFKIEAISNVKPIKESYYYINNSSSPLTKLELENVSWTPYEDTELIEEDGIYTIYAKVIDNNDHVSYISSDVIIIDSRGSNVTIKDSLNEWTTHTNELSYTYIDNKTDLLIEATDELSGIKSVEYVVSETTLSDEELTSASWQPYKDPITINTLGSKIIYVKVIDNAENVTYINSDYIVYAGYSLNSLVVGNSNEATTDITSHSKVTYNFTYSDTNKLSEETSHHLVSNIPFPLSSKIILKNNKNKKVYTYKVTSETTTIPFKDFKILGKGNMDEYFQEEIYDTIDEDYSITLDLIDTSLNNGINGMLIYLELHDKDGNTSRSTIKDTLKNINIHTDSEATPFINSNNTIEEIFLNNDSINSIEFTTGINFNSKDNNTIYDSTYDDLSIGLQISLIDTNGNIVEKQHLKNIIFKYEDNYYSPNNDGITRIKVQDTKDINNHTLTIITSKDTSSLKEGTYNLKISALAAYDGEYSSNLSNESINIPIIVKNTNVEPAYNFQIKENEDFNILNRIEKSANIDFSVEYKELLSDPNIRVSLYQKSKLTAYDQSYKLLDLNEYAITPSEKELSNVYYVSILETDHFELNLDLTKFKPTGYKFIFDLYDGNKRIGSIGKKFIVR